MLSLQHTVAVLATILLTQPASLCQAERTAAKSAANAALLASLSRMERWQQGSRLAELEQQVADYNADWIATASSPAVACRHRRLIALPLDETLFDPPPGIFSHGHVQTGDKMSLPSNFNAAIALNQADVPWLYKVSRIPDVTSARVQYKSNTNNNNNKKDPASDMIAHQQPLRDLDAVYGGPLDFRAPTNFVYLPHWMFRALGLRPLDLVTVELHTAAPAGAFCKLRPHAASFAQEIPNPQAILETELRHYSCLTQGATIGFDFLQKRYWFDVVELRSAPRNEKQSVVKVQDCNVATDFLVSRETLKEKARKKKLQQQEEIDE